MPVSTDSYAIVGAGALGSALGRALTAAGARVETVVSRSAASARRLAAELGAASTTPAELPGRAAVVFLCVPDDALEGTARTLSEGGQAWTDRLVAHTSGARPSSVLAPLAELGADVLSFHPMQSFTAASGPEAFDGIYVGLEGAPRAVERGLPVADRLGARVVRLTPEQKVYAHLAAAIASNFLVTLVATAGEVLGAAGVAEKDRTALLRPLVEGTWRNLLAGSPQEALTGPVVRGDLATVRSHLEALEERVPHLDPVYRRLSLETVRLAERSGRLGAEQGAALRALLDPPGEREGGIQAN